MSSGQTSPSLSDIGQAVEDARVQAGTSAGPYRELMATYVALGEALDSRPPDAELCRDLVERLMKLDVWVVRDSDQRWAVWVARNTATGGCG